MCVNIPHWPILLFWRLFYLQSSRAYGQLVALDTIVHIFLYTLSLHTHTHTHTHSTSVQMCNGRKLHFFCPILYIYLSLSHTHTDRLYLSHVHSLSLGEGHALLLCRFFPATYICTSHTHTLSHTFSLSLSLSLSLCVCVCVCKRWVCVRESKECCVCVLCQREGHMALVVCFVWCI